jgi:hypothetical protein
MRRAASVAGSFDGWIFMTKAFHFLAARLAEPTTWRGLIFISSSVGLVLKPELQAAIIAAGMALAGLIGVLVPDPATPAE